MENVYTRLVMYDTTGTAYFAINGELQVALVKDDLYMHFAADVTPICPDCAATGAEMRMRPTAPPPGSYVCDFCHGVIAPLFVEHDGALGRPRVQLKAEIGGGQECLP